MSTTSKLFQPIRLGQVQLRHRVVLSPMTRNRNTDDYVPTELVAEHYKQRGSTPGTLLVTEGTLIADKMGGIRNVPGIWSEEQIEGWKKVGKVFTESDACLSRIKVTDAVHKQGSFIFVQVFSPCFIRSVYYLFDRIFD
jgi:NADPH2 dehydrogenase